MLANQTYATQVHSLNLSLYCTLSAQRAVIYDPDCPLRYCRLHAHRRQLIVRPLVAREHDVTGLHSKPRAHFTEFCRREIC